MVAGSSTSVMNIVGSKVGIGDTAPSSPLEVTAGSGKGQGSFGYTNLELFGYELSMDVEQGGFFGLAVSGSTAASNLHNMANN